MLYSSTPEQSALATTFQRAAKGDSKNRDKGHWNENALDDKDKLFCDHCNRPRHTRETCWRLHDRPTRGRGGCFGGFSRPRANHTTSTEDIPPAPTPAPNHERALNTEELAQLHQFMARLETPTDTSSSVAHSGNLATALNASSTEYDDPWVIDSGTIDHMTGPNHGANDWQ
ncbi:uncharacterized protein LOC126695993 [Quercus robur]|uniref:uncharacterized protein LOC126695993 n=1 Tax=Quercus robur TaxID=38942 RepID=UPI0021613F41|nr:uncharacterized protein LOC126695993 [Quercus robur]